MHAWDHCGRAEPLAELKGDLICKEVGAVRKDQGPGRGWRPS
jgi:hypothetical protein